LAALATAIIAGVFLFDWNWVKRPLEDMISSRLGRPFQIAGDLNVDLGLRPRITVHDARLANPPWAGDQPMLEVQRAEFVVDLPALWHGRLDLPEVFISKPTLRLETRPDGAPNWRFKQSSGKPLVPEIGRLQISDASVRYLARGSGQSIVAHLDEVKGSTDRPGDNRAMALTGTGEVDGQLLHLKVSGPPLAQLRQDTRPYPGAVDLQLGKSDVAGEVTLDLGKDVPAVTAKLHSNRVDTTEFVGLLHKANVAAAAHQAAAAAESPPAADGTPAAAVDALGRIESALNRLDLGRLPKVHLELDYDIKDLEGSHFALHNVQLKTGLHDRMPQFALEGAGSYQGQPLTLDINAGPAHAGEPQQAYHLDARIEAGQSQITAVGTTDNLEHLQDLGLQLKVKSPDPAGLLHQIGIDVPELPGLQLAGQLNRDGNAWRLGNLYAQVGDSDLTGSLEIDLSGQRPSLTADLRSDRLRASDLMPGPAKPAAKLRPVVPPAGINLKALPDVDADVQFQGGYVQIPAFVFERLKLDLKLRNRVAVVDASGQGTFRKYRPVSFEVHAGNDQSLKDPQARYPIDLALHSGDTKASVKGTVDHPLNYTGLDADLVIQGPNLEALGKVLGLPLPPTPPYHLTGRITHQPDHERWNLVAIDGKVGGSDLEGDVSLELSSERPTFVADLKSKRLDLSDLGVLVGKPARPGQTTPEARAKQTAEAGPYLLPDKPFNLKNINAINARVSFTGESIQAKKLPLQQMSLVLTLRDGDLKVEPLHVQVADGQLESTADLNASNQALDGSFDLSLKRINLNRLLSGFGIDIAGVNVEKEGTGTFGGRAKLKARGDSVHELAASADGDVVMVMDGGQINALIIEAIGLDVGEILDLLLTKKREGAATTVPIECFVGRFGVQQGVMQSQALVLDTTDSTITGKGQIDLGNETLSLELLAHPKDVSALTASTPVRIEGILRHPKVNVISKELKEKSLAALALGVILPVVGAVLPFIETGATKGSNCGKLLQAASAAMPAEPSQDKK
jgi:uncharacterized protein involved in outer membrane biogenesis